MLREWVRFTQKEFVFGKTGERGSRLAAWVSLKGSILKMGSFLAKDKECGFGFMALGISGRVAPQLGSFYAKRIRRWRKWLRLTQRAFAQPVPRSFAEACPLTNGASNERSLQPVE
jgi:hypothetical protein